MDRLLDEISHLPVAERMLLAHLIVDSAIAQAEAAPVTPDQLAELRRRDTAIDAGETQCLPWETAWISLFGQP